MLKKLFLYELKVTYKPFLNMYLSVLIFSGLFFISYYSISYFHISYTHSFYLFMQDFISYFFLFIFFICVIIFFALMFRFKKDFYGDSAYLIMCLPVKPYKHILARFFTVLFWSFTTLLFFISVFITSYLILTNKIHVFFEFSKYPEYIRYVFSSFGYFNIGNPFYFFSPLFFALFFYSMQIIKCYLSISFGCSITFANSKQVIISVLTFVLLSYFEFILLEFIFYLMMVFNMDFMWPDYLVNFIGSLIFISLFLLYFYLVNKILSRHYNK